MQRASHMAWRTAPLLGAVLLAAACASVPLEPIRGRAFDIERDSFAFSNDILWVLPTSLEAAPPAPGNTDYHHRCMVVARSARQFFLHARFDPALPQASDAQYRKVVHEIVWRDPRGDLTDDDPVVVPGYADLREFSKQKESLLKEEMGSVLDTYFQRGNWRMTLPFTRSHQERVAGQVLRMVEAGRPAVVHVVRFPVIAINHAILVYAAQETPESVRFTFYDPNNPDEPRVLSYDRASRTFIFPTTNYFWGGPVNAYEIYRRGLF